ncbi:MAG: ComF family protein, partial [Clostridia bacterium]|nr:ComF family protein [Clostridia bacterium]
KPFCDDLALPLLNILQRVKDTPSQTTLSPGDRANSVKDAFILTDNSLVKGKNILIIEDVYTTGATIEEITNLLLRAGANAVYGLTLAHAVIKKEL